AVLVLVAADAAARLLSPDGPRPFGAGDAGPRLRGELLATWPAMIAAVLAVAGVAAGASLLRRGPLARAWRAWRAAPDRLALSGIESRRVQAVIGAVGAAAGGVAGLAVASAAGRAPEGAR